MRTEPEAAFAPTRDGLPRAPRELSWLLALALLAPGCGNHEGRTGRQLRNAMAAQPRPVEGRLSSAGGYAPWSGAAVVGDEPAADLERESGEVFRGLRPPRESDDPEELHRKGLLWLYRGKLDTAVSALEAAAERKSSALILSDLSVAYLASAEADRPELFVDSLVAARRAVELDANEPTAAFNLALAHERLALANGARLAWERYLELDDDPAWRQEASQRLARLREPTLAARWASERAATISAAQAGNRTELSRLARQFPQQSKELLETDLLPAWTEALGTPAAGERLAAARRLAEAVAATGDELYVEVVAAAEAHPETVANLAQGFRSYAWALTHRGDCSQAEPEFGRAGALLSQAGSPLRWAARLGERVCLYRRDPRAAERPLADLASALAEHRYPALLAKTESMRGLCDVAGDRYAQAVSHYERASQLLRGIGDTDLTRLQGMLAEVHEALGQRDEAWRDRLEALRGAVATGDRKTAHATFAGLARQLVEEDRREAAQAVLDEMLVNARAANDPSFEAETLLRRIQLHVLQGATEKATADIAACRLAIDRFPQPGDRERLRTELLLVSGEQELATSAAALPMLETATKQLQANADSLLLPRAYLDLYRTQLLLGDAVAAEQTLRQGLDVYEGLRTGRLSEEQRISLFSTAQRGFDAMIRFQALDRGDARKAFEYAEQVRARDLRDQLNKAPGARQPLSLDEELSRIPKDVAVVSYTVLPDVLLAWQIYQGNLSLRVLPVPRSEVEKQVDALRKTLAGTRSAERGKVVAGEAFDAFVRPLVAGLPAETGLVFVPDRELHRLPFAALFDTERGRFLIEDHSCLVAPSLALYLAAQERMSSSRALRRLVAVGDPAFEPARFPALARLTHAREEAMAISRFYPEAILLADAEATRDRILAELPGSEVVHIAAHVVVNSRKPLESAVATAGPMPLRASDLDAERLHGVKLVFLSGCDTAPGFPDGNREGVAGLARAVLAAQVPSVIATLWAVDDRAAARLAVEFHQHLTQGLPPEQALRRAQLSLIANPPTSNPFSWAPFQLFRGL